MKIGVYNRWLTSLGGGERHSLAVAAHLARRHTVDFVSHTHVDPDAVKERLDVDLDRLRFRAVPVQKPHELGWLSAEYDLFINASNSDFVPPMSQHNVMLVYFPVSPPLGLAQMLRRSAAQQIERYGMQPHFVDGVYGVQRIGDVSAHGLAERALLKLPTPSSRPYTVRVELAANHPSVTEARLTLDGNAIGTLRFSDTGRFESVSFSVALHAPGMLTITAQGDANSIANPLSLKSIEIDAPRARLYQRLFAQLWPELGVRQQNVLPANLLDIVGGYDLIWANSMYTARWIWAYWRLPSTVLYAPVPVERYLPHEKRPQILSVGRFFAGKHNKRHMAMIQAFKELMASGLTGWELHLVGGITPGEVHQEYLRNVRHAAEGSPITIHTDLPNQQVIDLYGTSSIYWHAAGYGESPTGHPEKFEHFGISVVEAMAAGCVPVVVGQGGLTELVRHEQDGFLWYTGDELQSTTRKLVHDAALRSRVAQAAIVSSRRFDWERFRSELDRSLAPLMNV